MFVLVDDHGSDLGDFASLPAAVRALEELIKQDPTSADSCGIVEIDAEGRRVGRPILGSSLATA